MSSRREFLAAAAMLPFARGASTEHFVRVSRRDPHYLELSDGSPYIPIGLNMISPPRPASGDDDLGGMEEWLDALSSNGGNYIRVWLSNPFWDVEHAKSGAYDEEKARRTDRLLGLCRRYGIRVKLTLEHFRSIGGGRQKWADKPLHDRANGGPASSVADFFDGVQSREQFRKKIAWFGKRYGSRPEVYGWELWNEINAVRGGDYMAWTETMLPELRSAFPQNLAMQSLGSFDTARVRDLYRRHSLMPGNDIAQVHRYLDLGSELDICKGAVDLLAADAVRELRGYDPGRPVILAESGAVEPKHTGPFKLYAADRAGIILHDILFAPFFAGAAGTGQIWHWDSYVAANKLWPHFGRFAAAVRGVDPVAERFEPVTIPHERLRVYALQGRRTLLAWCRDARNTWETELRDGLRPERLDGVEIPIGRSGRARIYDPWTGEWSEVESRAGRVRLPGFERSVVIRID